MKDQ